MDETFKVLLGNASGATVAGGTGTGTIRNDDESASAGQLIISEFRLRGPGGTETTGAPAQSSAYSKPRTSVSFAPPSDGADTTPQANDEFVELYNNTDSPLLVTTTDGSKGWALAASDGVVRFVVPAGTLIPARGHFLGVNTLGYSLSGYPAGNDGAAATTATGDPLLLAGGDDHGPGLIGEPFELRQSGRAPRRRRLHVRVKSALQGGCGLSGARPFGHRPKSPTQLLPQLVLFPGGLHDAGRAEGHE